MKDQKLSINDEAAAFIVQGEEAAMAMIGMKTEISNLARPHRCQGRRRSMTRKQSTVSVSSLQGKPVCSARSLQAPRARASSRLVDQREDGRKGRCFAAAAHDQERILLLPIRDVMSGHDSGEVVTVRGASASCACDRFSPGKGAVEMES